MQGEKTSCGNRTLGTSHQQVRSFWTIVLISSSSLLFSISCRTSGNPPCGSRELSFSLQHPPLCSLMGKGWKEDKDREPRGHRFCKEPVLWRGGRRAAQKPGTFKSSVVRMGWVASFLCSVFGA